MTISYDTITGVAFWEWNSDVFGGQKMAATILHSGGIEYPFLTVNGGFIFSADMEWNPTDNERIPLEDNFYNALKYAIEKDVILSDREPRETCLIDNVTKLHKSGYKTPFEAQWMIDVALNGEPNEDY